MNPYKLKIWVFYGIENVDCGVLVCYAVCWWRRLHMFWRNASPPSWWFVATYIITTEGYNWNKALEGFKWCPKNYIQTILKMYSESALVEIIKSKCVTEPYDF